MENKYTVTFKMVRAGAPYWKDKEKGITDTSVAGHLWYSLQKNNGELSSFGFQSRNGANWGLWDEGRPTPDDDKIYLKTDDSITIQINETQYNKLIAFGKNPANDGFEPSSYYGLWHNCVTYVFKALNLIDYNPNDINPAVSAKYPELTFYTGTALDLYGPMNPSMDFANSIPSLAFNWLIELLAENGAIAVEGNKLIPVSELKNIKSNITDNQITGYDDNADEIHGGQGKDTLIGKSGNDTLNGGTGNDILQGGEGFDTYHADEGDIIIDDDGKGEVYFNSPTIEANIQRHLNDNKIDEKEDTDYYERQEHGITEEVAKGKLTYAILESYTPGGSSASFAFGQDVFGFSRRFSEDFPFYYMPYRYEVQGLQLPSQRPKSPLVNFTADSLIVTPINPKGESVGESMTIKNFRNGDLGIHLLDIMSYRYSYFSGAPSFYAQEPNDDVVYSQRRR